MSVQVSWYQDGDVWECVTTWGVTVGRVRHAKEGEVEGGLGALARFMVGAFRPDIKQPSLSPAGYYWTATATRGVWSPWRCAADEDAAKRAVEKSLTTYFNDET